MMNRIISIDETIALAKSLTDLIQKDQQSEDKKFMTIAERYFNNKNDILKMDFTRYYANGVEKQNKNRSNQRISNNFFKLLVEQAVSYVAGNSITYSVKDKPGDDDEKFKEWLDDYLMFEFDDMVVNWLKEARKKGVAYLHMFYDKEGYLDYAVIPSEQVIPIYRNDFSNQLKQVVRYYLVEALDANGQSVLRKKVEWWTESEVYYFIEDEKGNLQFSDVQSHWIYSISNDPSYVEQHGWGKVPFIQLLNNDDATSDLIDIKSHSDAYDLIQSEFVNQIADVREILIKVLGYSGSSADEILQAFRGTGIVKIDDATGNIDVLKSEIPVDARNAALKNLKENIFMLGRGVDTNPERIGSSVSGIALKMLYGALDLKCNTSIRKLKKSLNDFIWFIVEDYNRKMNKNINYKDVRFNINKSTIANDAEIIESLAKSKGLISDETIIDNHPFVQDVTLELERLEQQNKKEMQEFAEVIGNKDEK